MPFIYLIYTFPFSLRNGFSFPLPFFFTVEEALELSDTVLDSESVKMFFFEKNIKNECTFRMLHNTLNLRKWERTTSVEYI